MKILKDSGEALNNSGDHIGSRELLVKAMKLGSIKSQKKVAATKSWLLRSLWLPCEIKWAISMLDLPEFNFPGLKAGDA